VCDSSQMLHWCVLERIAGDSIQKKEAKMLTADEHAPFLHWRYHPKYTTRQTRHCLYDETLAGKDGFDKNTI
jgi:hypothetical protein